MYNDPEMDMKLSKVLNPHWISHPTDFGYKPSKSLLLLSEDSPVVSPTLSWFLHVSSKTHWQSIFWGTEREERFLHLPLLFYLKK